MLKNENNEKNKMHEFCFLENIFDIVKFDCRI